MTRVPAVGNWMVSGVLIGLAQSERDLVRAALLQVGGGGGQRDNRTWHCSVAGDAPRTPRGGDRVGPRWARARPRCSSWLDHRVGDGVDGDGGRGLPGSKVRTGLTGS